MSNRKVWRHGEVEAGVWAALALDGKEVTPRRFIHFDINGTLPQGYSRQYIGPVIYDSIVFAKRPAGGVVDVCYNHGTHTVRKDELVWIHATWERPRNRG